MSVLERMTEQDGCIQCWAEEMLGLDPAAIQAELARQLKADPLHQRVGLPEPERMETMVRAGRREIKLLARVALLEPHECGRDGPEVPPLPPVETRSARL